MSKSFDYSKLPPETAEELKLLAKKINILSGRRRKRRHRGDGSIYFIQQGDNGPIKIGYTTDLLSRMDTLQTGSPYKLNLVLCFQGFVTTERELHAKFRKDRMRGEWFAPSEELMTFIEEKREWLA